MSQNQKQQQNQKAKQHQQNQKKQEPQKLSSVFDVADQYDYFIVDVWGVLHNGMGTFPFVKETLTKLRDLGKDIILLTNSPRSSNIIEQNLAAFGIIKGQMYSSIVTSGDLTKSYISEFISNGKNNCYFIGSRLQHKHLVDVDGLFVVDNIEIADFVLLSGPDDDMHEKISAYDKVLEEASIMGLDMLCANPDVSVMVGAEEVACAGSIARMYEYKGGEVIYSGKPFSPIYDIVYRALGYEEQPKDLRGICVGDSINTDIRGAKLQGLDSILVESGVSNKSLNESVKPTYTIDQLK